MISVIILPQNKNKDALKQTKVLQYHQSSFKSITLISISKKLLLITDTAASTILGKKYRPRFWQNGLKAKSIEFLISPPN